MSSSNNQNVHPQRSRSHRRQSRLGRTLLRLWSEWRLEMIASLFILLALFLLLEQMQIRETLAHWGRQAAGGVSTFAGRTAEAVIAFVCATTLSDMAAYALLAVAGVLVVGRVRWRMLHTARFTDRHCPRCGGDLHRIHRHAPDRLLNLLVPVRRYGCRDHDCQWSGLRVHKRR